jgi:hypothetical protein
MTLIKKNKKSFLEEIGKNLFNYKKYEIIQENESTGKLKQKLTIDNFVSELDEPIKEAKESGYKYLDVDIRYDEKVNSIEDILVSGIEFELMKNEKTLTLTQKITEKYLENENKKPNELQKSLAKVLSPIISGIDEKHTEILFKHYEFDREDKAILGMTGAFMDLIMPATIFGLYFGGPGILFGGTIGCLSAFIGLGISDDNPEIYMSPIKMVASLPVLATYYTAKKFKKVVENIDKKSKKYEATIRIDLEKHDYKHLIEKNIKYINEKLDKKIYEKEEIKTIENKLKTISELYELYEDKDLVKETEKFISDIKKKDFKYLFSLYEKRTIKRQAFNYKGLIIIKKPTDPVNNEPFEIGDVVNLCHQFCWSYYAEKGYVSKNGKDYYAYFHFDELAEITPYTKTEINSHLDKMSLRNKN